MEEFIRKTMKAFSGKEPVGVDEKQMNQIMNTVKEWFETGESYKYSEESDMDSDPFL